MGECCGPHCSLVSDEGAYPVAGLTVAKHRLAILMGSEQTDISGPSGSRTEARADEEEAVLSDAAVREVRDGARVAAAD